MVSWFVKNKVISLALTMTIVFCGIVSFSLLRFEVMPDTRLNIIEIECVNYGASPEDMEKSMIGPVESKLSEINQISRITSTVFEGMGVINAEINSKSNSTEVLNLVRDKIDQIQTFPTEAEKVKAKQIVLKTEILSMAVHGKTSWEEKLSKARKIKEGLVLSDIAKDIEILGRKINKLTIELQDNVFSKYGITPGEVSSIVQRKFRTLSLGEIDGKSLTVKSVKKDLSAYKNIPIVFSEYGNILLGDLARISFDREEEQITRFNGEDAVILKVYGKNALETSRCVKEYLNNLDDVSVFSDNADLLKSRLHMMGYFILWSFLVVSILLWFFLSFKVALFSSLGVLVSFAGTFTIMAHNDVSMNMVSLFAFLAVLGIIVDDSIIIGESIQKKAEEGFDNLDSSVQGVSATLKAVSGATLTNLIFFGSLACISGATGVLFQSLAVVVISALIISIIEASLLMPSHMAHYDFKFKGSKKAKRLFSRVIKYYGLLLERVIDHKYKYILGCFTLFIMSLLFIRSGALSYGVLDDDSLDSVSMSVKMSSDTDFSDFEDRIEFCEDSLKDVAGSKIKHLITTIHKPSNGVPLTGIISAQLEDNASHIESKWKNKVGQLDDAYVDFSGSMFGTSDEVEFELLCSDKNTLKEAVNVFEHKLRECKGVHYTYNDLFEEREEFQLKSTPYADFVGMSLSNLASQARSALHGSESFRFVRDGNEITVSIKVKVNTEDVKNLPIEVGDNEFVPLGHLAELSYVKSSVFISKISGLRSIKVKAVVDSSPSIKKEIQEDIIPYFEGEFAEVKIKASGIFGEQEAVKKDMSKLMLMGLFCAYIVLVLVLKDFAQPSIVLYSIPFSLIGILLGHLITGKILCINSFIGFMAVSGVVLNDALVLVDRINSTFDKKNPITSLVEACKSRLRPIFLTTLTTCLSVSSIFMSPGTKMLYPMAISIIFGLISAMLINIFFVPCVYLAQIQLKGLFFKNRIKEVIPWSRRIILSWQKT